MRLADRINADGISADLDVYEPEKAAELRLRLEEIRAAIRSSPRVIVDNVAEYCWGDWMVAHPSDGLEGFPNLAPPFGDFWVEFSIPSSMTMIDGDTLDPRTELYGGASRIGVLASYKERTGEPGWEAILLLFAALRDDPVYGPIASMTFTLDALGAAVDKGGLRWDTGPWFRLFSPTLYRDISATFRKLRGDLPKLSEGFDNLAKLPLDDPRHEAIKGIWPFEHPRKMHDEWQKALTGGENVEVTLDGKILCAQPLFAVTLLAITFMHCKNVTINDVPSEIRKPKSKKRGERPARLSFHQLEIRPLTRAIREGTSSGDGAKKALHICRGHFKEFTSKGLFGKHLGLFWWDSHLRGTLARGIVEKEYVVTPAGEPTSD